MTLLQSTCPRDGVATNISCSRCGDPICPQCMVYTPVGNKCRDCSEIGGPEIFKVAQADVVRGAVIGGIGSVAIGVVAGALAWVLWSVDILEGLPATIWWVVVVGLNIGGALATSRLLTLAVGAKYSNSLRVLAGLLGLTFFIAEVGTAAAFDVGPIVLNLPGMIGFGIGTYYGMNRFKVPGQ